MWLASIWRRLALLGLAVGGAALVSFLVVGPSPSGGYLTEDNPGESDVRLLNLLKHLKVRYGYDVAPGATHLVLDDDTESIFGRTGRLWFAATGPSESLNDVFSANFSLSRAGIPIAMSAPHNLTQSPLGDESILAVDTTRILLLLKHADRARRVISYEFEQPSNRAEGLFGRLVETIESWQRYGWTEAPLRTEFAFSKPARVVSGQFTETGFAIVTDEGEIMVDLRNGQANPASAGAVLSADDSQFNVTRAAWRLLEQSDTFGVDRVMSVARFSVGLNAWIEYQLRSLFNDLNGVDKRNRLPQMASDTLWPPHTIRIGDKPGADGEGQWVAVEGREGGLEPMVLRTFVRVGPARGGDRVELFAFDMRRLGLGYSAGAEEPMSESGARGTGRVPTARRRLVVAALNGGLPSSMGRFGVIEDQTTLVKPARGAATVVIDPDGRPAFGQWDAKLLEGPWVTLRQNMAPLIERQVVNPGRVTGWGQVLSELDEARMTRSAMGVTEAGVVIYAWAEAATAQSLGEAMALAGVSFAMHLDIGADGNGVDFFKAGLEPNSGIAGSPKMDLRHRNWTGTASRDFFYFFKSGRMSRAAEKLAASRVLEGDVSFEQLIDGVPVIARLRMSAEELSESSDVLIHLLESSQLRPHFVPGMAETRPKEIDARTSMVLPTAPLAAIAVGLRNPTSPHGVTVERRVWRTARPGVMTFVVDAEGTVHIGRYGDRSIDPRIRWSTLVQGPTILADGHLGDSARGSTGLPTVAAGITPDELLAIAISDRGDRRALAKGLQRLGVKNALLLGEKGTADTGVVKLFFQEGGRLLMRVGDRPALEEAIARPQAASTLMFTARRPRPSARFISTFMKMRISRANSGPEIP